MAVSESLGKFLADFVQTIQSEQLEWHKKHQSEQLKLKAEKAIAEQELKEKLEEMEDRFKAKRERIQSEERQNTRRFEDYLKSLDDLQLQIFERYPQMSRPLALMIHHQATLLLTEAWHNPNMLERPKRQLKFMNLMTTLAGEMAELGEAATRQNLMPTKTIELIKQDL